MKKERKIERRIERREENECGWESERRPTFPPPMHAFPLGKGALER